MIELLVAVLGAPAVFLIAGIAWLVRGRRGAEQESPPPPAAPPVCDHPRLVPRYPCRACSPPPDDARFG